MPDCACEEVGFGCGCVLLFHHHTCGEGRTCGRRWVSGAKEEGNRGRRR